MGLVSRRPKTALLRRNPLRPECSGEVHATVERVATCNKFEKECRFV
jgi:hypothetical protein